MRAFALLLMGLTVTLTARSDDDAATTVAIINAHLADDPFFGSDGYTIAMPSACVVELIPHGSRFRGSERQRIALHVLDRSATERIEWSDRGGRPAGWVRLVGSPERTSRRKGFPSTPDMNDKGFPKDTEAMLSYGVELRFGHRDSARTVAHAFVHLAELCVDGT